MSRDSRVSARQLEVLAGNLPFTIFTAFVIAVLAVVGSWPTRDKTELAIWMGVYVVVTLLRLWGLRLWRRDPHRDARVRTWGRRMVLNTFGAGLLWLVFGLIAFDATSPGQALFVAIILVGLTAASAPSLGPWRPAHTAFAIPTMLGLIGPFVLAGSQTMVLLGAMAAVYTVVNLLSARSAEQVLADSIRLRFDNERLVDDLARSNADLEQFAYVASHDLREPLRQVASYVNLLERRYTDGLDDMAREFIGYARDGATRMDRMVIDLLEYSRIGRKRISGPVDLTAVLEAALANLGLSVAETGARVSVPLRLPSVLGDDSELTRLFQNLIGNALKYRHPDRAPEVRIAAQHRGAVAEIAVADNGIGMDPEQSERIFAIFQRLHTREHYDGTGIGLAVCRKIVEHHGGRIWVDTEAGRGSTFRLTLPLAPGGASADAERPERPTEALVS